LIFFNTHDCQAVIALRLPSRVIAHGCQAVISNSIGNLPPAKSPKTPKLNHHHPLTKVKNQLSHNKPSQFTNVPHITYKCSTHYILVFHALFIRFHTAPHSPPRLLRFQTVKTYQTTKFSFHNKLQ